MLSSPARLGFPLAYDDPYMLGPYRLIVRIGGGGMGNVYLARDGAGRTVAVKSMHARLATDPEFRTRFRLETDAARVIGGRHGAEVVDADPLAPTPWLATEYLLGPPLDEAVERCGPLPEQSARAVGAALCEALGQLHSSDVVHRDLKPSNVLLTVEGPKVVDFGIARAIGDDRLTRVGATAGTPAYMSPEQATGGEHGPAGDVFALAGVLVFALTGHGPFGGGQAADLLYRVRYGQPDLTAVPEALRPVLERCLLKDPGHRPGTAELHAQLGDDGEFVDRLPDRVLAQIAWRASTVWQIVPQRESPPPDAVADHRGAGSAAAVGSPWPRYGPKRSSRRRVLAMAGGSALGVAAAVAGGAWAWSRVGGEPGPVATPSRGPGGAPKAVWKAATLSLNEKYELPPIAVGGLILSMDRTGLVAFDAKGGARRWGNAKIHAKQISTDGQRIYAILPEPGELWGKGNGKGKGKGKDGGRGRGLAVCALDAGSGRVQKTFGTLPDFDGKDISGGYDDPQPTAQPLRTVGNVLYLAARTRKTNAAFQDEATKGWNVVAFDLRAGRELWRKPLTDYRFGSRYFQVSGYSATCSGSRLLLTRVHDSESADERAGLVTLARGARTGDELWEGARVALGVHNDSGSPLVSMPTDSKRLYFSSRQVVAHRLSDGRRLWAYSGSRGAQEGEDFNGVPRALFGPPALREGVVYAMESERGLIALDALSGRLLWRQKGRPERGRRPSMGCVPLIGEKYVYVVLTEERGRTHLDAVSRTTHRSEWTFTLSSPEGAGTRFVLDEDSGRIVGSTLEGTYAIPLE
ncbi:protein kinase domain-containing protein [Streptomyces coffeae]|uniref:Protein kinase n=1 Tax=Streptomyces coffeae TaxID=621382 RepID=A0ABS1NQ25_9ACTN|nr:serine/threonine-protein kinase [Streptomyces coffeae]MBL1101846.1 protein kinase [Streptomyces coffeae]